MNLNFSDDVQPNGLKSLTRKENVDFKDYENVIQVSLRGGWYDLTTS